MESSSLKELEQIPGVGKTIARDMQNIGIHSIDELKGLQAHSYCVLRAFGIFLVSFSMFFTSADGLAVTSKGDSISSRL